MLKHLIYAGLGAASTIKSHVHKELEKCEHKGKVSKEDIMEFIETLEEKGKKEDDLIKEHVKKQLHHLIKELNLVTKEDLEKLKEDLK